MANTRKYISLDKLGLYDDKIKEYIGAADEQVLNDSIAYFDSVKDEFETAGAAITVKEELQKGIDAAKTAADDAQADADANAGAITGLTNLIGTLPEDATVSNVVAYIEQRTEGIATDAALSQIQADLDAAEDAIEAIEADYLKASDKTDLSNAIVAEADRAKGIESGIETRLAAVEADYLVEADKTDLAEDIAENASAIAAVKKDVDDFFKGALKDSDVQQVKDTLKEIQDYINSDADIASSISASIKANEDAIAAEAAKVKTLQDEMDAVEERVGDNESAIGTIQAAIGTGGAIEAKISAAVSAETTAREIAVAKVQGDADAALGLAGEAKSAAAANAEDIEGIQSELDDKALSSDLEALEARVDAAESKIATAEQDIDTLQSEMDAVEAKASANETAIGSLQGVVGSKADKTALQAEIERATAAEAANKALIEAFVEASEDDIKGLFN